MFTFCVLTSSDSCYQGTRENLSGALIDNYLTTMGFNLSNSTIVPDEKDVIVSTISEWADSGDVNLIITTGGTGLGPRDVTPEATMSVIDRFVPGIAEALRHSGMQHTPMAMLGRGVAGLRGKCLIINLPGSPNAVQECLDILKIPLSHALELTTKQTFEHNI